MCCPMAKLATNHGVHVGAAKMAELYNGGDGRLMKCLFYILPSELSSVEGISKYFMQTRNITFANLRR